MASAAFVTWGATVKVPDEHECRMQLTITPLLGDHDGHACNPFSFFWHSPEQDTA